MEREQRRINPYGRAGHVVSGHVKVVPVKPKVEAAALASAGALRAGTARLADPQPPRTFPRPEWHATSELTAADVAQRRIPYTIYVTSEMTAVDAARGRTPYAIQGVEADLVNRIDATTGEGEVEVTSPPFSRTVRIAPAAEVSGLFLVGVDYRRANLPGAVFGHHTSYCDFRGAHLTGAMFAGDMGGSLGIRGSIRDTSFDGATCAAASFVNIRFIGTVSFRGADLTAADFSRASIGAMLVEDGEIPDTVIDFTDSNVTGKQIDQLLGRHLTDGDRVAHSIRYTRYGSAAAAAALGVTEEEIIVMVWAGDIDVRDNETGARVPGQFDAACHHIPQWVFA